MTAHSAKVDVLMLQRIVSGMRIAEALALQLMQLTDVAAWPRMGSSARDEVPEEPASHFSLEIALETG